MRMRGNKSQGTKLHFPCPARAGLNVFKTIHIPDSNDMLDPRGHDVDRPHSFRRSDVGSPRKPNASLLVGSTWNPHDGSTSDPHMPECRFHVQPTSTFAI